MTLRQPPPLDDYREVDQSVFRQRLTVADIMTPRQSFMVALAEETAELSFRMAPPFIDALPVMRGRDRASSTAPFIGIIDRRHIPSMSRRVEDVMDPNAAEPVPADLPLIDFIASMPDQRLLLVSDRSTDHVVGLVTIHDLSRLSARLAIFALLLAVEETLGEVIARFGGNDETTWAQFLSDISKPPAKKSPRQKYLDALSRAHSDDGSGSVLSELSLSQKLDLLDGARGVIPGPRLVIPDLLTRLRNTIAHGNPFAHRGRVGRSVVSIHAVPKAVSDIRRFRSDLHVKLGVPK